MFARHIGRPSVMALTVAGCAVQIAQAQNLVAGFSSVTDTSFDLNVTAPPGIIREYAVCKGVWFAEKKKGSRVWFGDPHYSPASEAPVFGKPPADWLDLHTTIYLAGPGPEGNPAIDVGERAAMCRQMWNWYQ